MEENEVRLKFKNAEDMKDFLKFCKAAKMAKQPTGRQQESIDILAEDMEPEVLLQGLANYYSRTALDTRTEGEPSKVKEDIADKISNLAGILSRVAKLYG